MRTDVRRLTNRGSPRDPPGPRIPELEPDYELLRELGRGGTAVVYLARERELGRYVAIKLIRSFHVPDEEEVGRLEREARTVARLQHPNIVALLGVRRLAGGGLALVLQYVPGTTLRRHLLEQGALPFSEAEAILQDVGRALAYTHRQGIVHRDVKPENIHLDGEVRVARLSDFGIAQVPDGASMTLAGGAIGTPTYMSPEQVDGLDLDGRSDLYSLGLVGYEMLTGHQPWAGEGLYRVLHNQKHEELPPLERIRPDVPRALRVAIERAVAKDPEDRWRSAEELLEVLRGTSSGGHRRGAAGGSASTRLTAAPPASPAPPVSADAPTVFFRPGRPGGARPRESPEVAEPEGIPGPPRQPAPDPRIPHRVLELQEAAPPFPRAGAAPGVGSGIRRALAAGWGRGRRGAARLAAGAGSLARRGARVSAPAAARAASLSGRGARRAGALAWRGLREIVSLALALGREVLRGLGIGARAVFGTIPHLGEVGQLALLILAVAALLAVLGAPGDGAPASPAVGSPAGVVAPGIQEGTAPGPGTEVVAPAPGLLERARVAGVRTWYRIEWSATRLGRGLRELPGELWRALRELFGPAPIRAQTAALVPFGWRSTT